MKLIVGLGNPGEQYEKTRHNLGYMVVEQFVKDFERVDQSIWTDNSNCKSDTIETHWQPKFGDDEKIILAKPKTYMNNSGMAVSLLANYYKVAPSDIWIIHDELDLPLGTLKIRFGGASAGHKGVESIMTHVYTDKFWRFRLGIGEGHEKPSGDGKREHPISKQYIRDVDDFVLGVFSAKEKGKIRELIRTGSKATQAALEKGMDVAMNRYNTK